MYRHARRLLLGLSARELRIERNLRLHEHGLRPPLHTKQLELLLRLLQLHVRRVLLQWQRLFVRYQVQRQLRRVPLCIRAGRGGSVILRQTIGSSRLAAVSRASAPLAVAAAAGIGLSLKMSPEYTSQLWLLLPAAVAFLVGWSNAASP